MLAVLTRYMFGLTLLLAAAVAHSAPKTVLVLGDSLSAEYGLARGAGWVALMENRLKNEHVDAAIVNASISGETTSGGRVRLPALLAQYHPALLLIELGANDGLRGLPVAAAETNLRAMVEMAHKAGARVLLVGMRMPPNYGRAYTDSFFAMYARVAKESKTALVPFMLEGVAQKPEWFQSDRLHPVAQAHPIILSNIYPALLPLLKGR
jgi:acyl-CoA thioesterase-1